VNLSGGIARTPDHSRRASDAQRREVCPDLQCGLIGASTLRMKRNAARARHSKSGSCARFKDYASSLAEGRQLQQLQTTRGSEGHALSAS
jgi:hypothetical protein